MGGHPAQGSHRRRAWSAARRTRSRACSTSRSRPGAPSRAGARTGWSPCRSGRWRARLRRHRRRHPADGRRHRGRARGVGRRPARGAARRADRVRRPRWVRHRATRTTARSSRRSSATRSARARAPTSSSAATTAPSSPTGTPRQALTVLRRLMERERGAYWTFCFFTGERFLIGASPERHVTVRKGDVRMNPISGTFRVGGPRRRDSRTGCSTSSPTRRRSSSSSWWSTRSSR